MRTPNFTPAYCLPSKRKCHTRPHGHTPSVHCALYNLLYAVLPDTMLRQYVFAPVATEYFPQTDHLSDATVIPGCRFVCLCLWHCCRLILLPPTRLQPPLGLRLHAPFLPFFSPLLYQFLAISCGMCLLLSIPLPPRSFFWLNSITQVAVLALSLLYSPFEMPLSLSASSVFCSLLQRVRSHQYCIELFPSLLSDLAVIEPERSPQMDFSEKDTVMSGNLLLPCAN